MHPDSQAMTSTNLAGTYPSTGIRAQQSYVLLIKVGHLRHCHRSRSDTRFHIGFDCSGHAATLGKAMSFAHSRTVGRTCPG